MSMSISGCRCSLRDSQKSRRKREVERRSLILETIRRLSSESDARIFLLGSQARSVHVLRADFDAGVLASRGMDPLILSRIRLDIDERPVLRPADIVN